MTFARYIGEESHYTRGRIYPARPEMNGQETVGFGFMEMIDNSGQVHRENPENGNWEFLDEVYAVALVPLADYEAGEVFVVTDISLDRGMYRVRGSGFYNASLLALLDPTIVYPGLIVCDASTGIWQPVRCVDECLWLVVGDDDMLRSPEEFRFAVSEDKELLVEPVAKCVDDTGIDGLTTGNVYRVQRTRDDSWTVIGDNGMPLDADACRFSMGS